MSSVFSRVAQAFAKPKPKAAEPQAADNASPSFPEGQIVSVERPQFGSYGEQYARVNLDTLAAKETLKIYSRMRIDEQVKAVCTFKRDAIVSRGWTFEFPPDCQLPEAEQELRTRVFEKSVNELDIGFIDALNVVSTGREYGYSLTEKVYDKVSVDGRQYVGIEALLGRDPTTFQFYTDEFGRLKRCEQWAGGKRVQIDLKKFVHYVHNPEFDIYFGRSDLREAYRSWYFKEVMLRYWALYMEKLGGGMLVASLKQESNIAFGSAAYDALTQTLSTVKASASVLMPIGVEAQVVFPSSTDGYEKACTWHDMQIAKALLVPNLAGVSHTGQTGSYSQAQSQLESFAWTLQADTKRLESCVDKQLFRDLGEQNWGDGEYPCFKFKPLSDSKMQWLIDSWAKQVGAGTVISTEADEVRLREILEMPPRDKNAKPLVDPATKVAQDGAAQAADQGHQNAKDMATHQHNLSEQAKENDIQRQAQAAADAQPDPAKKKAAYARARVEATRARFGFNPDQGRDDHGRWAGDSGAKNDGLSDKAISKANRIMEKIDETGRHNKTLTPSNPEQESQMRRDHHEVHAALHQAIKEEGYKVERTSGDHHNGSTTYHDGQGRRITVDTNTRPTAGSVRNPGESYRPGGSSHVLSEFTTRVLYDKGANKYSAPTLRDGRLSVASARERVDFAVIDRKSSTIAANAAADVASVVAKFAKGTLGDDRNVAELTDQDMRDIANVELPGVARGRIKTYFIKALAEGWALGRQQAREELRRVGRADHIRSISKFADLRGQAADYFDANGFRMAGNASDGTRAVIQQELINSVKNGRSPTQTRTAIWERLVAKGFSSREAVRSVETDQAVNDALDALWVDDEEQAAHYLDTLARTNIFESLNEARYAEFTDPALDGFVVAFRFSSILDDRTTEVCTEMHDHVYASDSGVWDAYRPPLHFNCRSILVPITVIDRQDGMWDGVESEDPAVEPQAGFGA